MFLLFPNYAIHLQRHLLSFLLELVLNHTWLSTFLMYMVLYSLVLQPSCHLLL
ncbi:ORF110 [Staphylococcus phage 37]|uniref:ORF110 n=1 Tax=Staphylococcus phage 37 TaxID=2936813 RepID=Q4ZCB3_9CAUD|nr:ORF110 [Staphylococcus phage 37]AAX91335.1 ORF110 [Staphylococcus phage 37]